MSLGKESVADYRNERERLASFKGWPLSWLSPVDLAADGFYYLGNKDQCMCAFCRGIVLKWDPEDTPRGEHKRYYPDCPFINNKNVSNVSLEDDNLFPSDISLEDSPKSSEKSSHQKSATEPDAGKKDTNKNNSPVCSHQSPSVIDDEIEHLDLRRESCRLETFKGWPLNWLSPVDLAKDGFYYLGKNDYCQCIFCRLLVMKWEKTDTPRGEHEKHKPECPFINGEPVGNIQAGICY